MWDMTEKMDVCVDAELLAQQLQAPPIGTFARDDERTDDAVASQAGDGPQEHLMTLLRGQRSDGPETDGRRTIGRESFT